MPSLKRHASRFLPAVGWLAFAGWLVWRCNAAAGSALRLATVRDTLTYFYVDASFVLLALAIAALARTGPSERSGWLAVSVLAAVTAAQFFVAASTRYYAGAARAWDLANYVQPLWRAAHCLPMDSATYDARPIWGDHGSLAMFLFAPFTRMMEHAAPGLFAIQSVLAAASVLVAFGCGLALGLPVYAALGAASVLASSRALAAAARFDFHPECALGVALLGIAWAHARGRLGIAVALTLLAASLRDMAALTVGMLWCWWAVCERTPVAFALTATCFAIAGVDMFVLPRWTGWYSYADMNASAPIDLGLAAITTCLRSLSSFGLGWLHPIGWFSGAPWMAAAALSPKLGVKGIDFQYGFLFVPVALLGALHAQKYIAKKRPASLAALTCAWIALAVSVNAPRANSLQTLQAAHARFDALQRRLDQLAPRAARLATDACAAPYVVEREHLTLLCRLDVRRLQETGQERWEEPVDLAPDVTHLVVRQDCESNGPCAAGQVQRAQDQGFRPIGRAEQFVVLERASVANE